MCIIKRGDGVTLINMAWESNPLPLQDKLDQFEKYARRQSISRFLARYELFKMQLEVKGSIVEGGVHHGAGLMGWAKLSAALEPYAIHRWVVGFDTFSGFPTVAAEDNQTQYENEQRQVGGFDTGYDVYQELNLLKSVYDDNRFLNQFDKVKLVVGDVAQTLPQFLADNPHFLVSMLVCDFDLYEPTKIMLEHLVPRMPEGAVLVFDEVNNANWPGETTAMLESFVGKRLKLKQFPFDPNIAYAVME
jgi:hypothetical protein